MSSGKVILGLLAGVAAGAIMGILFAPDKGSSTRKRIARKGEEFAESLTDKMNEFLYNANEEYFKAREEDENVRATTEKVKKDVKTAASL